MWAGRCLAPAFIGGINRFRATIRAYSASRLWQFEGQLLAFFEYGKRIKITYQDKRITGTR